MYIYFLILLLLFCNSHQKSNVYFTRTINSSNIVRIFKKLNVNLTGNIGLKVHSGENGGKYFLTPDFLEEIYNYTNGTYIECNTAYENRRHSTELHRELLKEHGWLDKNRRIVIMDENPSDDFNLTVDDPLVISENIVGAHLREFNSCLVLAHFKGHGMGGFGGALKQLSIGFASQSGKTWIHTGANTTDWTLMKYRRATSLNFTAAMGDAASSIVKYFRERGGIAFISVMSNISLYCDCAGNLAPEPRIHDMGILASTDPVAIDRACLDLIKLHVDNGTEDLLEQIKNLDGENTIFAAEKHKTGTQEYNLIDIDSEDSDDSDDEPETPSDYTILIIVICSIFGILLIGGIIGFIIYKKKQVMRDSKGNISLVDTTKDD
jgi:uncharacterized Fe-S center protein